MDISDSYYRTEIHESKYTVIYKGCKKMKKLSHYITLFMEHLIYNVKIYCTYYKKIISIQKDLKPVNIIFIFKIPD